MKINVNNKIYYGKDVDSVVKVLEDKGYTAMYGFDEIKHASVLYHNCNSPVLEDVLRENGFTKENS